MVGQTLGHYRVESKLGQGGMGVVYRARDLTLDRDFESKVLVAGSALWRRRAGAIPQRGPGAFRLESRRCRPGGLLHGARKSNQIDDYHGEKVADQREDGLAETIRALTLDL